VRADNCEYTGTRTLIAADDDCPQELLCQQRNEQHPDEMALFSSAYLFNFRQSSFSPAKKKVIDPFDPEASVPLPYQLEEQEKRISKVDTLRLAIRYIKHLEAVLKNEEHIYK
ncbi:hypothetical protein TELCIR_17589, partial [Teladorsagia circumcincta]